MKIEDLPPADELLDVPDLGNVPQNTLVTVDAPVISAMPHRSNGEYIPSEDEGSFSLATRDKPNALPEIYDVVEFSAQKLARPPELIGGILHQGTKMLIGGGSKSFKTWIQLHMAIAVATGNDWLGQPVKRGRVLFANFEIGPAFFQDRIRDICSAMGVCLEKDTMDVWNLRGFGASYDIIIPEIIRRTADRGYNLDILDPIYKLYGTKMADENSTGQVAQLLNQIESMCVQTGAACSFGAHFSKGNQAAKDAIDRTSGSGVWGRDPDTILTFTRHEEEDCFTVEPVLRNFPPVKPFVVRWKFPLMVRDENLDPSLLRQVAGKKPEHDPLKLLMAISDTSFSNPISITAWAAAGNVIRQTLQDYLPGLRSRGLISTAGEGSHARQYITEKGRKALGIATAGN